MHAATCYGQSNTSSLAARRSFSEPPHGPARRAQRASPHTAAGALAARAATRARLVSHRGHVGSRAVGASPRRRRSLFLSRGAQHVSSAAWLREAARAAAALAGLAAWGALALLLAG